MLPLSQSYQTVWWVYSLLYQRKMVPRERQSISEKTKQAQTSAQTNLIFIPTYSLFNFFVFLCAKLFNINIYILKISPNEIFMRKFISGLFGATPRTLTICSKHDPKNMKDFDPTSNPVPYAKDYCHSCNDQICHVCSENHVHSHCDVECNYQEYSGGINNSMGTGSL